MRELTPRDKSDIRKFESISGMTIMELDRYLSGQWEWHELWDYNFDRVDSSKLKCKCVFEGLRASGRRKGYPLSIRGLERFGCTFSLIGGGGSHWVDAYYECSCGQKWKQVFVEAMQYMGNHAHPIADDEFL